LANDFDIDSNITLVSVGNGTHGYCTYNSTTNNVTYTPNYGYHGTDNFTYVVTDGLFNVTCNVTVIVIFVDQPPVAVDDSVTVYQNVTTIIDPLVNDWDEDNDTLTIIHANCSHGVANITNNTIAYTPNPGYLGEDTIEYTIDDGHGLNDSAIINVTILYPPTAFNHNVSTLLNTSVVINVLEGAMGSNLTIGTLDPMVSVRGNLTILPNNSVLYTPPPKFIGNVTYTYTVKDYLNTSSNVANITVIVYCEECEKFFPPVPFPDNATTLENTPVDIDVLQNDVAVNFDMYIIGVGQPGHGTAAYNPANNIVTYTPNHNFAGVDNFTYVVSNGIFNAESNVTVTVVFVPQAPVAADDTFTMYENTTITIDPLLNDYDEDNGIHQILIPLMENILLHK